MYQIIGQKFEQIIDPSSVGVLDASKAYFVVFTQHLDVTKLKSA